MPTYLFWPLLLIVAGGSFLLGVRVEGYRWRQRCKDTLAALEAAKKPRSTGGDDEGGDHAAD